MKVAIFGKVINEEFIVSLQRITSFLGKQGVEVLVYAPFALYMESELQCDLSFASPFHSHKDLDRDCDFFLCVGGDGTFLDGITFVRDSGIPMVGIHHGRLGFLADIQQDQLEEALQSLLTNDYVIETRSVLQIQNKACTLFADYPFGLNDFTVHKTDSSQMIQVETFVDGCYLATYWADGLIVATPTGSTAYSLSVGGPVLAPTTRCMMLTPIAAHQLTVRPVVVPDTSEILLRIGGRGTRFMASLDSKSVELPMGDELIIKKAEFDIRVVKLQNFSFYSTLRNKLMWGEDKRN